MSVSVGVVECQLNHRKCFELFVRFVCCISTIYELFIYAFPCIVVLIVWPIGQVLVLCAAFLCLSDWLMLHLHTELFYHCAGCSN